MSQNSPRLNLPFLQPSQAQKHVTHNEALRRLDLVVQLTVASTDATTPPAVQEQGEIHALGATPSGDWAGHGGELAAWLVSRKSGMVGLGSPLRSRRRIWMVLVWAPVQMPPIACPCAARPHC